MLKNNCPMSNRGNVLQYTACGGEKNPKLLQKH